VSEHTPEPWKVLYDEARGKSRCLIIDDGGCEIAAVNPYRETWNQNARLIAAAPDLLAACQAFVDSDCQDGVSLAFAMAINAITKATEGLSE
jgi:hypothetical protein